MYCKFLIKKLRIIRTSPYSDDFVGQTNVFIQIMFFKHSTHLSRVGYASMPPTRCQPNSMPARLDAKPTFNSLTFKLLFTNVNLNPNQSPGIELAASSWAISLIETPGFLEVPDDLVDLSRRFQMLPVTLQLNNSIIVYCFSMSGLDCLV